MATPERMKNQLFLKTVMSNALYWMANSGNQKLGVMGEIYVTHWLKLMGFDASDTSKVKHQGDVTVIAKKDGKTIHFEVKTSKRDIDGNWQFCLRKSSKTSIDHSDYVVLLAVDDYGKVFRYVVPADYFGKAKKFTISSHPTKYNGKIAPFIVRSDEIDLSDIMTTYQLIGV